MTQPTPLQFFRVVLSPSPGVIAAGLAIPTYGIAVRLLGGEDDGAVMAMATLFQMFAASTSYRTALRRGHFDPVLVGRRSRWSVAAAHSAASIAPGLAVWLLAVVVTWSGRLDEWPPALTLGSVTAVLYVSAATWALTLALPRYIGGFLWITLVVVLASGHYLGQLRDVFARCATSWTAAIDGAGAALVLPLLLMGSHNPAGPTTASIVAVTALAVYALGLWTITRFDGVLVEPS